MEQPRLSDLKVLDGLRRASERTTSPQGCCGAPSTLSSALFPSRSLLHYDRLRVRYSIVARRFNSEVEDEEFL